MSSRVRRGKAPPVDPFWGEDPECRLDDWFLTLKRAADLDWLDGGRLTHPAGRPSKRPGPPRVELIADDEKRTYSQATGAPLCAPLCAVGIAEDGLCSN